MLHRGHAVRRVWQLSNTAVRQRRALSSAVSESIGPDATTPTETESPPSRLEDPTRSKVIFSGIQPTGVPHLGNYFGALREWVRLQNEADEKTTLIYCLVDLHAITIRQDPEELRHWKRQSLATLLAIGLDPKRSIIFNQSSVAAHAELMWLLSCQASTGYLGRMTQWKDKTAHDMGGGQRLKLGLFSYPVLQAADILVHKATHVPVGHDQAQHLEFARELAISFNSTFGDGRKVLTPPETLISPMRRVMSLLEPTVKMSKSAPNPKSRITLTDTKERIEKRIKGAVTDSIDGITYDPENRPGLSNLIDLLYHSSAEEGYDSQEALAKDLENMSKKALKTKVADSIDAQLRPIRERYMQIIDDYMLLESVAAEGSDKASRNSRANIRRVKKCMGL